VLCALRRDDPLLLEAVADVDRSLIDEARRLRPEERLRRSQQTALFLESAKQRLEARRAR
jgi:hypothetical protein